MDKSKTPRCKVRQRHDPNWAGGVLDSSIVQGPFSDRAKTVPNPNMTIRHFFIAVGEGAVGEEAREGGGAAGEGARGRAPAAAAAAAQFRRLHPARGMSDFAATDFTLRSKFQSNLIWDSIKSISNFCF
jgi:hypothetical protein